MIMGTTRTGGTMGDDETVDDVVWPWGMSDQDPDPESRPWVFNPRGFLLLVLAGDDDAARACSRLQEVGFPGRHLRTYSGPQLLREREAFLAQQGRARRVVESLTIDSEAVELLVNYAQDGRAFIWVVAPRREDANRAIRGLSDIDVLYVRYYGDHGVEDLKMA
jgi:hypothetical protein